MIRLLPICIAALISIFPIECSLFEGKKQIPISDIGHEDPDVRLEAINHWAILAHYPEITRELIDALDDEDADIRKGACGAFFFAPVAPGYGWEDPDMEPDPGKVLGPLIELLTDEDESVCTWAALAIRHADPGYTENIPHIINGLSDMEQWYGSMPTSYYAADTLKRIEDFPGEYSDDLMEILRNPPALTALNKDEISQLAWSSSTPVQAAVKALCQIEPDSREMIPLLREALSVVEDEKLQTELVNAIGQYASRFDEAIQLLVDLTSDANDYIAERAIETLADMAANNDDLFPIIFDLIEHVNEKVALKAVETVCEYWRYNDGVLARISELAFIQYGPVGRAAAKELVKFEDLELQTLIKALFPKIGMPMRIIEDAVNEKGEVVIPTLLEYLDSEEPKKRGIAADMLQRFVDEKGKEFFEAYGDPDELAIEIKLTSGDDLGHEYLPMIRERLKDEDIIVRNKAVWSLTRVEPVDEEIIRLMFETYESADHQTGYIAKLALDGLAFRSEEFAAITKEFLDSDNPEVRIFALTGLTYIFIPLEDTVPVYIELLQCDDAWVRQRAAYLLMNHARNNTEIFVDAIPALIIALDDEGDGVANYACRALGEFGAYAVDALPKLRECADYKPGDPHDWNDLPTWAERAIEKIEADLWE